MKTTLQTDFPSASEWATLLALYDLGGSAGTPEVTKHLDNPRWANSSVRIMLVKLAEKGWVERFHPGRRGTRVGKGRKPVLYRVVVSEQEALQRFADHLAEFYFSGDVERMTAVAGFLSEHDEKP